MKQEEYTEDIINGRIPNQNTFTHGEVDFLLKTLLAYVVNQINDTVDECKTQDMDELISDCGYKTIKEALIDKEMYWQEEIFSLSDFLEHHFDQI